MEKIRVGVIGLGGIASWVHIPGLLSSGDCKISAICDIDKTKLAAWQSKLNIPDELCFENYSDLIESPSVDAVTIATPNYVHFEIAKKAIQCKKPYSLEKPVTMTKDEAKFLYDESINNKILNMVCFSYRFKNAARYAKKLIESGKLGNIYHVYAQYFQDWATADVPLYWRFDKQKSGSGALGDLGCHVIDLVSFITGKQYVNVSGTMGTFIKERKDMETGMPRAVEVDDYCHFFAEMEGKTDCVFEISRFAYGRGNYQRVEIYGDKGSLVYNLEHEDKLEVCIGDVYKADSIFTQVDVSRYKSHQMQSFIDIIKGVGDGLAATIEDGYKNQIVLDGIIESCEKGGLVTL